MSDSESSKAVCEYCSKEFTSKYTLKTHLERNKKCIKSRGHEPVSSYTCQKCDFVFMAKSDLTRHLEICKKEKKDDTVHVLKEQVSQLLAQLKEKDQIIKELAEKAIVNAKPSITNNTNHNNHTNNTTINNLQVISEAHINDHVKHLTIDHIKRGALGYSEYFLEYPLKERVVCTDYSRRKLKYKNEQGEIVSDPEMTTLSDLLFKSIKEKNRELTIQYSTELTDKFKTTKDPAQLAYFMEVASKFSQQDLDVFKMFSGNKNEFFHDILRNICSKTVVQ
jgi:cell division septum initiation protein DivIVA